MALGDGFKFERGRGSWACDGAWDEGGGQKGGDQRGIWQAGQQDTFGFVVGLLN